MTSERLPVERLAWTVVCLALAVLPNLAALPVWVLLTAAACAGLRLTLAARGLAPPAKPWRLLAAGVTVGILLLQYHTFNGITAGTALLCLMAGLKLLETEGDRDIRVALLIIYFLSIAALLRSTSFWLLSYLLALCWLTTATLMRLTAVRPGPGWRASLRHSGRMLLQALPLALALWLLFPRFTEPLWQVGDDGGGATSGLSDSMSPGDISDLALSEEIAFRVRFDGAVPPEAARYWRGPVLDAFDGSVWRRSDSRLARQPTLLPAAPAYRYTISLEPYRHNWIYLLDRPVRWDLGRASLTGDQVLVQAGPLSRPIDVTATSYADGLLPAADVAPPSGRDLALPPERNPRTRQLAEALRARHPDDRDYLRRVLTMLHEEAYYYTLSPPRLGADSVDEFLFVTKRGFCGHYASAFAVMMRAAGIPARVVTGYQGGKANPYGDYWIVRQSDAHAWDEVWLAGSGWVRIDPTSVIAAARVERRTPDVQGAGSILGMRLPGRLPWLANLGLRLDALRQEWRERILQFDQNAQQSLLSRLMIPDPDTGKLVLALAGALGLLFAWLTWAVRRELRAPPADAALRAYARLCAKLARIGLPRRQHEGAESFAQRVAGLRPDLAQQVGALARQYTELRYGRSAPGGVAEFAAAVRAFRATRRDSRAS